MSEASKPMVAFVVPAYNAAKTIRGTLDSILAQDWPRDRMEVVVVDNGSTDGTPEIARRYPVKLVFEAKRGRSAPRNRGVAALPPEAVFIASVDSDCVLSAGFLKKLVARVDRPWTGAAQAAIEVLGSGNRLDRPDLQAHYYLPYLATGGMLLRREAFEAAGGFDEELARNVDMDFSFRLLACGYALAWEPERMVRTSRESRTGLKLRVHFGMESGKASYQLNAKWRHRIHRSDAGLALDRLKGWTLPLARRVLAREPGALVLAAETAGRAASWTWHRLAGAPVTRGSFAPATRLPEVLGPERYLLLHGRTCTIYDAPARRVVDLGEEDTAILEGLIDGVRTDRSAGLERRLGLPVLGGEK